MVKVTSERIPDSQVRLEIEVEPERIQQSVEKAYRRIVGRVNIPGFRRGKAPRRIVEQVVGKEALFHEGLEDLVDDVYSEALKELALRPVARPDVDLEPKAEDLKPGEPLTVKATVAVEPEIELGDYRSIRVQPLVAQVTDLEVNQVVDRVREEHAEWVPVDRQVAEGDRITLDIKIEVGAYTQLYSATGQPLVQSGSGRAIVDEQSVDFTVEAASPRYPRGVVDQIIGMKPGEEKQFEISLPPDYSDAELANHLAQVKVKVSDAKEKHLPSYDDEFAKLVGFESFDQMREGIRESSQARADRQAQEAFESAVIAEAVNRATFEVPAVLVEHEIDHQLEHAREDLQRQGIDFETFLRITGKTEAQLRDDLRGRALNSVKASLVIERIAEAEQITALPEDVDREAELLVSLAGPQAQRVRQTLSTPDQRESLARRIARRKAVDFLIGIAQSGLETVSVDDSEQIIDDSAQVAEAESRAGEPVEAEADEVELASDGLGSAGDEEAVSAPPEHPPAAAPAGESSLVADEAAER
jgi:trigger factor